MLIIDHKPNSASIIRIVFEKQFKIEISTIAWNVNVVHDCALLRNNSASLFTSWQHPRRFLRLELCPRSRSTSQPQTLSSSSPAAPCPAGPPSPGSVVWSATCHLTARKWRKFYFFLETISSLLQIISWLPQRSISLTCCPVELESMQCNSRPLFKTQQAESWV